ncbi:hypothetical protein Zmor_009879 [Zophobas morio]|uniref:Uncharacterized protein n=1 Tax=Zophobas morio TaxID=2755281 RepID=A0AA38IQC6_9CUCU|nr:hypothetical protein Zmor_009879 [Zophobas morio]
MYIAIDFLKPSPSKSKLVTVIPDRTHPNEDDYLVRLQTVKLGGNQSSWCSHHSSLRASCASFNPPFICKSVLLLVPSLLATEGLCAMCMLIFHPVSVTVGYTGSSVSVSLP